MQYLQMATFIRSYFRWILKHKQTVIRLRKLTCIFVSCYVWQCVFTEVATFDVIFGFTAYNSF